MNKPIAHSAFFIFVCGITLLLFVWGIQIGSFETEWKDLYEAIFHFNTDNPLHYSIINLRMPRLLLAFVSGASLALCGYIFQVLMNNPLADPFMVGTASGASLGANLTYFGLFPLMVAGVYMPPIFAFIGATSVTVLVAFMAYRNSMLVPSFLILAGIAINTLITAIISLITFLSGSEGKLKSIIFWMMGGFEKASWENIMLPLFALIMIGTAFILMSKQLSILLTGEEQAKNLGLNVTVVRWLFLIGCSVMVGFTVSVSGPIGFVGLIIPHVVRAAWGTVGKGNLLYTILLGGCVMLLCDILSRYLLFPAGIPVGVVTSFMGVPFFIYLLLKKNYRFY